MDENCTAVKKAERKMPGRIICLILCACLAISGILHIVPANAAAEDAVVKFSELNDASVFLKQSQPHVCTLTSSAMLLRRAAMLSGDKNWQKITEKSIRKTAWLEGTGLRWEFTVSGITVAHKALESRNELIQLLDQHPEGIVIYNTSVPHAILVTDYTDGTFYCSDPVNNKPAGRIPVSQASITVESASRCWYVKSPDSLSVAQDEPDFKVDKLMYRILDEEDKTVACTGLAKEGTKADVPDTIELDDETYQVVMIAEGAFEKSAKLKKITLGADIESIGQRAFYQCKKLKTITIHSSNLSEIGVDAFAKIHKKAQIYIPADMQMETFAQLLSGTSVPGTVKINIQSESEE